MRAVNLLTKDESRGASSALRTPLLVAGGASMLVAAAVGFATYTTSTTLKERRADLAMVQAELAANPRPPEPPAWVGRVQGAQSQRATALTTALGQRLWWDRFVSEVAAVLPDGVWLTRVDGQLADPSAAPAAPAPGAVVDPTAGSNMAIEGVTDTHALVARLIARLSVVPDFSSVTLQSSVVQPQPGTAAPVQFRVLVGLRNPGGTP
jgi:Tfp pilus assembly protein PilN